MRRIFVVSIAAAALSTVFYLVNSRQSTTGDAVPVRPAKQTTLPESTITDPAVRAALEKEYQRVLALRKEALRQARARLKREAEEERRKIVADERQTTPAGQIAATPVKKPVAAPQSVSPPNRHETFPDTD